VTETIPARFHQAEERFGERPLLFRKTSADWQSRSFQQLERTARGFALALMDAQTASGGVQSLARQQIEEIYFEE
jgi:hypothetical protein